METIITKHKLPKTQGYPIKTSFLTTVIKNSKFDPAKIESIEYLPTQHPHHLFGAHYKGKRINAFARPGTINITINAVNSKEAGQVSMLLQPALQKYFIDWLNKLEENKFDWCDESHGFHVWYKNNSVEIDQ